MAEHVDSACSKLSGCCKAVTESCLKCFERAGRYCGALCGATVSCGNLLDKCFDWLMESAEDIAEKSNTYLMYLMTNLLIMSSITSDIGVASDGFVQFVAVVVFVKCVAIVFPEAIAFVLHACMALAACNLCWGGAAAAMEEGRQSRSERRGKEEDAGCCQCIVTLIACALTVAASVAIFAAVALITLADDNLLSLASVDSITVTGDACTCCQSGKPQPDDDEGSEKESKEDPKSEKEDPNSETRVRLVPSANDQCKISLFMTFAMFVRTRLFKSLLPFFEFILSPHVLAQPGQHPVIIVLSVIPLVISFLEFPVMTPNTLGVFFVAFLINFLLVATNPDRTWELVIISILLVKLLVVVALDYKHLRIYNTIRDVPPCACYALAVILSRENFATKSTALASRMLLHESLFSYLRQPDIQIVLKAEPDYFRRLIDCYMAIADFSVSLYQGTPKVRLDREDLKGRIDDQLVEIDAIFDKMHAEFREMEVKIPALIEAKSRAKKSKLIRAWKSEAQRQSSRNLVDGDPELQVVSVDVVVIPDDDGLVLKQPVYASVIDDYAQRTGQAANELFAIPIERDNEEETKERGEQAEEHGFEGADDEIPNDPAVPAEEHGSEEAKEDDENPHGGDEDQTDERVPGIEQPEPEDRLLQEDPQEEEKDTNVPVHSAAKPGFLSSFF